MKNKPYEIKSFKRYIPDGILIKEFREKHGYGLRRTAEAIGISPTYLVKIEQGEITGISLKVAHKIDLLFAGKLVPDKRQY